MLDADRYLSGEKEEDPLALLATDEELDTTMQPLIEENRDRGELFLRTCVLTEARVQCQS